MTVQRDIEIVQGQTWTELFLVDGLVSTGNGLRMHLRDHHGATLLRAALAHDNAANERISFATGGVLANLGASISTAWDLQGQPVRRWVYSIERYSLTDVDDVTVLFAGTAIVKSNPTDESSITPVAPHPSYDDACLRFDVEQALTEPQKSRARANAGFPDGGALAAWGGIGGTLADQSDLVAALAAKSDTGHTHTGTYEPAGTVATHAGAADPHPGYLRNLAIDGTAALLATVSSDGESLGRGTYTEATLIAAAAASAPVQSVAGRTGAVVIAVGDVSGAEATANKAQANGYASLDSGGKVPQAQIPAIAITEYLGDVASQAAMLALSGQKGDWCTRSDTGATWIITGTDPTLLGSWTSVTYPASPVTSVAGRTGAVTISSTDITDSTSAGRAVMTAANAAAIRTAAGVVIGTDVQAYSAVLAGTTASFTTADETKLDAIEALADVTDAGNVGTAIDGATAKTTPVDADTVPLIDSAAANVLKKLSWASIKSTAKAYFDTLYQAKLVSGTNIKTVNSTSLLGSGDIAISANKKWVGAGELIPRVTSGAGIDGEELATNKINLDYLAFDSAAAEYAQVSFAWPGSYTTFTATFHWTAASGSGTVTFTAAARCYADDDALDQSQGTAQSVTDTLLAANDAHKSSATSAVTPAGTVASGNLCVAQFGRDIADTLAVDARLIGVMLEFA